MAEYVSRAGAKLEHALKEFKISVEGLTCADLGCSTGGFTDCLLQHGAKKVYAVDTGYGVLNWKLRNDPRVVVMERKNAMHVELPEKMDFVSVDTSWTRQKNVLPHAFTLLKKGGRLISLIKPHYEAESKYLSRGKLKEEFFDLVIGKVEKDLKDLGIKIKKMTKSPIAGEKGGNTEYLILITA
ncbi:methyltransferase domain-containing protein [Candidatus Peregrinibacteria bacterium]|nr:methyltransferase domain-containing protein [Candidatus Peregrinibacteria bacterium]